MRRVAYAGLAIATALGLAGAALTAEPLTRTGREGPVSATLSLTPAEPVIGDRVQLELEVVAEPGVELLMPEFGDALDRFAIVDFAPSEGLDDAGRTVAMQRYTLELRRSGPQAIPPLRVEFVDHRQDHAPAPEGEDAYELLTERLAFEVTGVLPDGAPLELRPRLPGLRPLEASSAVRWPWILAVLVVAGAGAPFAVRGLLAWRAERRRRSAYDVARTELDSLLATPRPSDRASMDAFFVELSGIVRRYVENRFGLRSPELTTEEFLEALADSPELLRTHQQLLQRFLRRADLVKFAHAIPEAADVEESIGAARRFLEQTREEVSAGSGGTGELARA
jgi:hypothetical protein